MQTSASTWTRTLRTGSRSTRMRFSRRPDRGSGRLCGDQEISAERRRRHLEDARSEGEAWIRLARLRAHRREHLADGCTSLCDPPIVRPVRSHFQVGSNASSCESTISGKQRLRNRKLEPADVPAVAILEVEDDLDESTSGRGLTEE